MDRGMNDPEALEAARRALEQARTADDIRRVWEEHFLKIGHKRLGRLLLGRDPLTGRKV